jgi:hypothetical protein
MAGWDPFNRRNSAIDLVISGGFGLRRVVAGMERPDFNSNGQCATTLWFALPMHPDMTRPMISTSSRILRLLCVSLLTGQLIGQDAVGVALQPPEGMATIEAKEMMKWATYLASDEMGGRLTGSVGQKKAAVFITKHFEALGLEPLGDLNKTSGAAKAGGDTRGFEQRYPLVRTRLVPKESKLVFDTKLDGQDSSQRFEQGFSLLPARGDQGVSTEGEFVYAGMLKLRRYKPGVDLESWTGKIPVFAIHAPKTEQRYGVEQQMMMGMTMLGSLKRRVDRLANKGAKAAVICVLDDNSGVSNMLTYTAIAPGQDLMSNPKAGGMSMGMMMKMMQASIPVVFVARKVAKPLLASIGLSLEMANEPVEEEVLKTLMMTKGRVDMVLEKDTKAFATNVVAVLRGSDPALRGQAVLFSAHMDHVGTRMDGDAYNGADDNASGTAGLMAIAKAFSQLKKRPRRSIIFLSVSGEELGLWGSAYYAKNPTWPVEDIVAGINTDMIGRNGPESGETEVTVTPSYRHRKFSSIVRDSARIGKQLGLTFSNGDKYYERSDHVNFARVGIPVVFFCNGEHDDYHQVSDHAEKLDAKKMETIARLAYWTGVMVAGQDERPQTIGRSQSWAK